jgi:fibro-slime domain-containing protein
MLVTTRVLLPVVAVAAAGLAGCGPSVGPGGDGADDDREVDAAVADAAASPPDATRAVDGAPAPDAGPIVDCEDLSVVYRDLQAAHPDVEEAEARMGADRGIVAATLGADHKPVYAHAGATKTVSGPGSFAQWFNTDPVASFNVEVQGVLRLEEDPQRPGMFVYSDSSFFPIDGRGFEVGQVTNNFGFTTEIHTTFRYGGGERFTFQGDDDLFVFVNGRLAIDLGGVHTPEEGIIDFDARAAELGLSRGMVYALDVFHAERHTVQSNFHIETTIECFLPPVD